MLKSIYPVLIAIVFPFINTATAQRNYFQETKKLADAIEDNFYLSNSNYYKEKVDLTSKDNPVSYLWGLCAMFEAANEEGRINGNYKKFRKIRSIINKYRTTDPPAPGYASYPPEFGGGSRFYDDNQWIGITAMDAHDRTGNREWLKLGKEIYGYMMTGNNNVSGGGIFWKEFDYKTKNTCSNGPGILLALQLYKATKEAPYLDTAKKLYNWVNKNLRNEKGIFWDNLQTGTGKIDKRTYSYNSGTMLQSNVLMYEVTKEAKYLNEAIFIADNASTYFLGTGSFRDGYWFNAVLLRGYQELLNVHPDKKYINAFRLCLDKALDENKNSLGLMGKNKTTDLVSQGGMLEILARFAGLQKKKIID